MKQKYIKKSTIAQNLGKGLTKNGKRMGRPPKNKVAIVTQSQKPNLKDAIDAMFNLVKNHKDLFISFDSKRDLVEFMWQDEVYQVPPQEVEQTLSAMKYLEDRELKWCVE